jgi:hypothetical protein
MELAVSGSIVVHPEIARTRRSATDSSKASALL